MWEQATDAPATIIPGTSMRKYVKSWVNQWDFQRLFPNEACELVSANWKFTYEETPSKAPYSDKTAEPSPAQDSVSQEAELVAQVFSHDADSSEPSQ